ncbi:MAG: TRAP transporter small permease [Alphaproteobacteria bacterium]
MTADPLDINEDALAEDYAVPASRAGGFAWPIRILTGIAAIFMASIAGVTFVDVTGRYVFSSPIPGGVEIIEFLLGLLIFSALPLVVAKDAHITVELFDGFMSEGFKRVREIIVLLANAGVLGFITSRMWATGREMAEYDEISLHLQVETAPLLFALTALSAMSVLTQLYMVRMLLAKRATGAGGDG